jgi:CIC family chloride channel protein
MERLLLGLSGTSVLPPPLWAAAGSLLTVQLIYRIAPLSSGEGIPAYIRCVRNEQGRLPIKATFSKFFAAMMTIGTFGIGGIVGPLGRVAAGILSWISIGIHGGTATEESRTAATCGMAAVVGAVFHSSIGGGLFAVEIIQRSSMNYRDLFPAILASSGAVFLARALGYAPFYPLPGVDVFMGPFGVPLVIAIGTAGGIAGMLFNKGYELVSRRIRMNGMLGGKSGTVLIMASSVGAAWLVQPALLGTSRDLIRQLFFSPGEITLAFAPALPLAATALVLLFLKSLGTSLTVGTGMSAGFVGPVVIVGMLLGASFCDLLGIPLLSPLYYAALAAGFASLLASVMNVPIAAAVIVMEIFGLHYGLPAALASIIGFQLNRSRTVYDLFPVSLKS